MGEGFPRLEGPSGAQTGGNALSVAPAKSAGEVCRVLHPQRPHLGHDGPGSGGGRVGGEQEMQAGGALQNAGAGEEWRVSAPPTWAGKPAGLPSGVPHPLRPEAWTSSVPLTLSPTPHTPQGLFQPCGS